uniref:Uncharacterized protein n=1 Tax=Romanomermis culicivorax TaxID=13658 RepID=A0A915JK27_ROMCU
MSLNNMRLNGKCYFLQANRAPYLYEINCTLLANEFEQKPPSIDNIFEFIGMSDPNMALRGNCTNEQVNEVDNISKNICRSKILQAW